MGEGSTNVSGSENTSEVYGRRQLSKGGVWRHQEAGVDRTRGTDGVDRGWRVRGGRPYGTLTFNQRAMEAIRTFPA